MNEKYTFFEIQELKGADWEATERHINAARASCSAKKERFGLLIEDKFLTPFQLMYLKKGMFPFCRAAQEKPDKIIFIQDGIEKVIKDRNGRIDATLP